MTNNNETVLNCRYCLKPTILVDSSEVYQKSYGLIYLCRDCQAWVGVHKNSNKPKGEVAKEKLRKLRKEAHQYLDCLWQEKLRREKKKDPTYSKTKARKAAYKWLAEQLEIKQSSCHIAMFDEAECEQAINICKPYALRINKKT